MTTANNVSQAQVTFARNFDDINNVIEFDSAWNNGTGYMDHLVHDNLGLEPGQMVKTTAPGDDARRVIVVGTRFGNCVYFERYSPEGESRSNVIVSNVPDACKHISREGSLSGNDLQMLCDSLYNVGRTIERLFSDWDQELEDLKEEAST